MIFIVNSWQTGVCLFHIRNCLTTDMLSTDSPGTLEEHLAAQITSFPTVHLPEHSEHLGFRGASELKRLSELGHDAGSRGRQGS